MNNPEEKWEELVQEGAAYAGDCKTDAYEVLTQGTDKELRAYLAFIIDGTWELKEDSIGQQAIIERLEALVATLQNQINHLIRAASETAHAGMAIFGTGADEFQIEAGEMR